MDKKLTTVLHKNEGLEKMVKVLTSKNNKVENKIIYLSLKFIL